MELFITLLVAHLIGDFPLQTNKVFQLKMAGHKGLSIHVAIHLIVAMLLLGNLVQNWPILLILGVAHYVTDWLKVKNPGTNQSVDFVIDQVAHLSAITIISLMFNSNPVLLPLWIALPAVVLLTIPAIMTFIWVWANQAKSQVSSPPSPQIQWASCRLLTLSQRTGWVMLLALLPSVFIF